MTSAARYIFLSVLLLLVVLSGPTRAYAAPNNPCTDTCTTNFVGTLGSVRLGFN